jgi:hypothetical protein
MALTMAGAVFAGGGQNLHQDTPITIGDDLANTLPCTADELQALEDAGATVAWHFILTSPSAQSGHMDATFSDGVDSVTNLADTGSNAQALHWYVFNNSLTLESAMTTDVTGGEFNLSHTCQTTPESTPTPTPEVTPTPTLTLNTPTPTLPQTSTIDQSNTGGPGTSLTVVFALILAIAGGLVAYAMRPRRVGNR